MAGTTPHQDTPQPNNAHREPGNDPTLATHPIVETEKDRLYRPGLHFTPPKGFMNDPNGLIFDGTYYHLYYQYNPFGSYAGHVHWGHAVSTDLYSWYDMPAAIQETSAGEAYSGCVVLDRDNKSGLFPPRTKDNPEPGALPSTTERAEKAIGKVLQQAGKPSVSPEIGAVTKEVLDGSRATEEMTRTALARPKHPSLLSSVGASVARVVKHGMPGQHSEMGMTASPPDLVSAIQPSMLPLDQLSAGLSGMPPMDGGLVAIYTRATPQRQTQYVGWSPDGGGHFIDYEGNPVLDIGHNSFRDPKVLWHEPSGKWVMVVVRARDHKVSFYGSFDLLRWMHLSDFGPAGLFGVDYECPGLIELDVEGDNTGDPLGARRWVLFVSVNPGGPQGGSATQYFVGQFDGERFIPEDTVVGFTDFAKDSYALQTYADMPGQAQVYFAWLNNWQYCEEVPNKAWRGTMTLPRQIVLRRDEAGWLRLVQRPYGLEAFREKEIPFTITRLAPQTSEHVALPYGQAVELLVDVTIEDRGSDQPDGDQGRSGRFVITFSNAAGESLSIGFDAFSSQLWLDRSNLRGFSHPFFTGSFSTPLVPGSKRFSLQIVLDASTLEIFANDGMSVGTALIYPLSPFETLNMQVTNAAARINHVFLYPLTRTIIRTV